MEETHLRNAATGKPLDVCKSCYADYPGCSCGRCEWVPLPAAIIEARMILEDAHREKRRVKEVAA